MKMHPASPLSLTPLSLVFLMVVQILLTSPLSWVPL